MACCGLTCEYIDAKLDAAENNSSVGGFIISRNLLLRRDEVNQAEIMADYIETGK